MKIGRYEILEVIGQGAMGTVYKALDPLIERTVAIKTISIARLKAEGPEFEARFLREAQSAGRLSHPNIVTIYDVGETDDLAYIAMEYLRGITLRDVMDKGPIPLDLVVTTALQIAEALAYAHENGVIHRDIKPSNIVVTLPHGQVKLADFGIAHLANSEKTFAGMMLGSPRYMSPEQAMGRDINGRSDIFSLGAVLYEMVTGYYAFDGDNLPSILYKVINETPIAPAHRRPEITAPFERIIMRMVHKEAEARLDSLTLIVELHKTGEYGTPLPPINGENRVPLILQVIAFGSPFAVLVVTGISMIVINYFLALAPKETLRSKAGVPLLTTPNNTILEWETQPQVDLATTLQNTKKSSPNNFSTKPKDVKPSTSEKLSERLPPRDAYLQGLDKKKVEYEIRKTELLLKYTEQHPDVVQVNRQLIQLDEERRLYLRRHR